MNIRGIKQQANHIYLKYRQQIIPEFSMLVMLDYSHNTCKAGYSPFLFHSFYHQLLMVM